MDEIDVTVRLTVDEAMAFARLKRIDSTTLMAPENEAQTKLAIGCYQALKSVGLDPFPGRPPSSRAAPHRTPR